ncbi:protein kinase [Actinomadura barringtoniae]|uniref:non-specific serine/threonine protein kinase n=1 Tax=Actinomadura barringtoniae TaxID=1427535 RepID=A0A939T9D4_9ACTN|nr:protein kinase [Actinomadura barringtoniae]
MEPLESGDPEQVGDYRLLGRLGGGGMGQVYFGRSAGGRPVAVKLVRPEYGADRQFRRRFAVEVEAARRVGGFFTAQVVDADPDAERPWLVTAYVPGPSLRAAVLEHGPLPASTVRTLGAGLAEGLAAIHECGLVHRDLKPGNVILAADGPRVIDFGIARALEVTSGTTTGAVFGTPAYMSPEQARGEEVGPASDVFSLGAVLAYAATGSPPFGDGMPTAVVYRIVQERPDLKDVPPELAEVVEACLTKDPAGRPEVADVLAACASPGGGEGWLPAPVDAMVTAIDVPAGPPEDAEPTERLDSPEADAPSDPPGADPAEAEARAGRGLGRLFRRRRAAIPLPAAGSGARGYSAREAIAEGWNGVPWGSSVADFKARFPEASFHNGEWWWTGQGPEKFFGVQTHITQYSFNKRDQLCMVALIPSTEDRDKLAVAAINELGAPDDSSTSWTIGKVEVAVKIAGIAATVTHLGFVDQ